MPMSVERRGSRPTDPRELWTPDNQDGGYFTAVHGAAFRAAAIDAPPADAAAPDALGHGVIEAVITRFGVPDSQGRIIEEGAFDEAIERFGLPAVVWTHLWEQTPVGVTLALRIEGDALVARGQLFVGDGGDDGGSREALDLWRACTVPGGDGLPALRAVSIGAWVTGPVVEEPRDDGGTYWRFERMDLVEWGPCLRGAHPDARIRATAATRPTTTAVPEVATVTASADAPPEPKTPPEPDAPTREVAVEAATDVAGEESPPAGLLDDDDKEAVIRTMGLTA